MKTLLISGSTSHGSHTAALIAAVAGKLTALGSEVEIWDLAEKPLLFSQPSWHQDPLSSNAEVICDFYEAILKADAIVLGTPLYHGSYSGVLKNALDCLTGDAFMGKPVGLVSSGSNIRKAHQACLHLTTVVMTMEGTPAHTQIGTGKEDFIKGNMGLQLSNEAIKARCQTLAEELHMWVGRLKV